MILKVTKTNKVFGDIYISGSKNAALPCICAALMTKQVVVLDNIPDIEDVNNLLEIIKSLGVKVKRSLEKVTINAKKIKWVVMSELVSKLRGSYYLMGALLFREGRIKIKYPGGCDIGSRPIDYHLKGFTKLGFIVEQKEDFLEIKKKQVCSCNITFPSVSLGATINMILAASSIDGETIINNPSTEPEVECLVNMLNKMGANIEIKEDKVIIKGIKKLKGVNYTNIYDRIEAGSYMILAGAITNSYVVLHNVNINHLEIVIVLLRKLGVKITKNNNSLIIEGTSKINKTNLLIGNYPFFPTDLQQILTVLLTKAIGTSKIEDPIFPNRVAHLKELRKMGGYVYDYKHIIYIKKSILKSAKVKATDLRCAFALIVAGAMARGTTYIKDIDYLFRGYVEPLKKLKSIGINVEII